MCAKRPPTSHLFKEVGYRFVGLIGPFPVLVQDTREQAFREKSRVLGVKAKYDPVEMTCQSFLILGMPLHIGDYLAEQLSCFFCNIGNTAVRSQRIWVVENLAEQFRFVRLD